ncbi:zinc finger CCCH domain-containing protein 11A-like [Diorhabda sublineata]|uniref:zinc finger CCCH domain-containing protein 11A-like n=1 Tax=Diorhabda sublineata TaxID=1163346 RepID=UPI0024E0417B|nr:zinc finger CCCH domain-containing protein 11A-like [Diorhabda sublineata]
MPAENYYCLDNFFKKMTDLDSPKKNNDCYFYYYSTCAKGDSCTFRHEPSALGCETMCSFWKEGKCVNVHCNFRHMELRKNRKAIPCYWESQPMGCLKAHCPFMHQNPRPSDVNRSNLSTDQTGDMNSTSDRRVTAVDSLVVNFEEESDNESTPSFSPKKNADWVVTVKSLDEIRLEKIQAESAAYYDYNSPCIPYNEGENNDANSMRQRIVTRMMKKNIPERIVTPKRRLSDDYNIPPLEKKRKIVYRNEDGNLEIILKKNPENYYSNENFRNVSDKEVNGQISVTFPVSLDNRRVNQLKTCSGTSKSNITDIKIKTLDEIRRERKAKEDVLKEEQEVTSTSPDIDSKSTEESQPVQNKKKIILRRHVPSLTGTRRNICDNISSISEISNENNNNQVIVQKNIDTESTCSKLDEDVYLLEDDDFDDETMSLKPEEELLNEIDACLDN